MQKLTPYNISVWMPLQIIATSWKWFLCSITEHTVALILDVSQTCKKQQNLKYEGTCWSNLMCTLCRIKMSSCYCIRFPVLFPMWINRTPWTECAGIEDTWFRRRKVLVFKIRTLRKYLQKPESVIFQLENLIASHACEWDQWHSYVLRRAGGVVTIVPITEIMN